MFNHWPTLWRIVAALGGVWLVLGAVTISWLLRAARHAPLMLEE